MKSGVYIIRCIRSGAFYIGSSKDVEYRWKSHKKTLRSNNHHNIRLQRLWNKYGSDSIILESTTNLPETSLMKVEQLLLDRYFGLDTCLNLSNKSEHPNGFKHTIEAIEKIRQSSLGRKHSEETKELIRKLKTGIKFSQTHRDAMSRVRINQSCNVGSKNGMYGKHLSQKHKNKLSELCGELHPRSKLNNLDVWFIREHYPILSYSTLASIFGVDKKSIINIVKRRTWNHI